MSLSRFLLAARSSLWLLPLLCVAAGIALATVTLALDRRSGYGLAAKCHRNIQCRPEPAEHLRQRDCLADHLGATVTLVAVQLAMGQFSPRIVLSLLKDRPSQLTIGLFGATFVQTVLTLRAVDDQAPGGGTVPGLPMLVCYSLMLGCVVAVILFVHHSGRSLRAAGLIDLVWDDSRALIDKYYPGSTPRDRWPVPDARVITAPEQGIVIKVQRERLVAAAARVDCVLELVPVMGDFVPRGAPLLRVHGDPADLDWDEVARLVLVGAERSHAEDPAYGQALRHR